MSNSYVIITPVRNEQAFIAKTIESVVSQTVLPAQWVIVDDGSTDTTPGIVHAYATRYSWIKPVVRREGVRGSGEGVARAFGFGLNACTVENYNFVVKLDGDLSFDPDYFEKQLDRFAENPKLGISSGKTYVPKDGKFVLDACPDDHTRGSAKMYRCSCFEDIGGLKPVLGWDTIDELTAQMNGWITRSYSDLHITHYKPIGFKRKGTFGKLFLEGKQMNLLGYHPLFVSLKAAMMAVRKPRLIGGVVYLVGFFCSMLRGSNRVVNSEIVRFLRNKQLARIGLRKAPRNLEDGLSILIVVRQFYPLVGGIQNVVLNLAREYLRRGHRVHVVTLNRGFADGRRLPDAEEHEGIKITRIPYIGPKRYPIAPSVIKYVRDADLIEIHCVDFFADFLSLTRWFHRKPLALFTHGGFFHTNFARRLKVVYFHTITRCVMLGMKKVICGSEDDYRRFSKITPKAQYVPNGVDVNRFLSIAKHVKQRRILYVGRLGEHKRVDKLIRLVKELSVRGIHADLDIVGPDWGGLLSGLIAYAQKLGVAEQITFSGMVDEDELKRKYAEANLFMSASEFEGFGISAVEAMASGTVCLLHANQSFVDILGCADEDFVIDFDDTDTLVERVAEVFSWDKARLAMMGKKLKQMSVEYSWERVTDCVEHEYHRALANC